MSLDAVRRSESLSLLESIGRRGLGCRVGRTGGVIVIAPRSIVLAAVLGGEFIPFLDCPREVPKLIYITNSVESGTAWFVSLPTAADASLMRMPR